MSVQTLSSESAHAGDPPLLDYGTQWGSVRRAGGDILAPGFAMTVAAWIAAYVSRVPVLGTPAPGQVTISLMLAMVLIGGFFTGRYSTRGVVAAVLAGLVSGVLDILVVGSVLHDASGGSSVAPAGGLWIGGSLLLNGAVAGVGGTIGVFFPSKRRGRIQWTGMFALVLAAATLPLITAGGLVTAFGAGLAVPDWPQSYGYNMFLFPLSKMQSAQGNFYEHAHRLMGSLVGLTSLTLAVHVTAANWRARRGGVIALAWGIFAAVCVQGLMGGLRVTEKSIALATVHGIFAQMVFASMACLAVTCGYVYWNMRPGTAGSDEPEGAGGRVDHVLPTILVGAMLVQLCLGALVRQRVDWLVMVHITMATVVAVVALAAGLRAIFASGGVAAIRRAGIAVMYLLGVQLVLGVVALAIRPHTGESSTAQSALWTTAHQANGALMLATCAVLALLSWRASTTEFISSSPAEI